MPLYVNQELVEDAEIRAELRRIRPQLMEAMAGLNPAEVETRARQWARENLIERVVLRQAAARRPGASDGGGARPGLGAIAGAQARAREEIEMRLRVERLFGRVTAHLAAPRNKDITEYYRKNRESFHLPERVHAAHIVKTVEQPAQEAAALALMQDVERQLRAGGNFEELANQYSDCPGQGGDLGIFPRGEMVPEFESVVWALQPGEVSSLFQTPFGFHIAKLYRKIPEGLQNLEEVREKIQELLLQQKKQRAIEQYSGPADRQGGRSRGMTSGPPDPCCVPSKSRAAVWTASRAGSAERLRAAHGSTAGMVKLDGGPFLMGTENPDGFPQDGEGPVRAVTLDPFFIDRAPVTNQQFAEFVKATEYQH